MKCGNCEYSARIYNGQSLDKSKYTFCSLRKAGTYKHGNFKSFGWTKVLKTSEPKWCPLKHSDSIDYNDDGIKFGYTQRKISTI